jgi:hypothetical protein
MRPIPDYNSLAQFVPNRAGAVEIVRQPFYDFQSYPAAGSTQLLFFQVPAGQSSKTLADTNMTLAGQFPSPTTFLVEDIQVAFFPGSTVSQSVAAARALNNWIDVVAVSQAGWLEFTVGSKVLFRDAPIGKFPTNFTVGGIASIAALDSDLTTTSTADVQFARMVGKVYETIPIAIPQSQNFSVSLNFASAVSVQNGARIGVILNGVYYRLSQ